MLGVHVERVKTIAYVAASLLTGLVVAVSGSVGYVGLIIPHIVRLGWGSDNRLVIPAAAFAGAIFVVIADVVARTAIAPRELPVGAVTALVGVPVFIYLLRKQ
jgi:iron complex transport system permease protein